MTTIIKYLIALILALISQIISAQSIVGAWNGMLSVQGVELPILIDVKNEGGVYSATLTSPKQSSQRIPVDKASFVDGKLVVEVKAMAIKYEGVLQNKKIVGTFTQGPGSLPLDLQKEVIVLEVKKRNQEPLKPYPYIRRSHFCK